MPGVNPVILLENEPEPVPSIVFESAMVGFADVLQQAPLAVTPVLHSPEIFPPDDAVVEVMADISVVLTVGKIVLVVNEISLP